MTGKAPALSFGLVDGRPVFMDECDDSYFLLDQDVEAKFLAYWANADEPLLAITEPRDALGLDENIRSAAAAGCERPRQSLAAQPGTRVHPRLTDALPIASILHRVRRSLVRRPIGTILADLAGTAEAHDDQVELEPLVGRARRFLAARPLIPLKANCLLDSLALLSWIGAARRGALLVFGVKLDPFSAHCWVQTGSLLLNDRVDNVERFVPVRVVKCSAITR